MSSVSSSSEMGPGRSHPRRAVFPVSLPVVFSRFGRCKPFVNGAPGQSDDASVTARARCGRTRRRSLGSVRRRRDLFLRPLLRRRPRRRQHAARLDRRLLALLLAAVLARLRAASPRSHRRRSFWARSSASRSGRASTTIWSISADRSWTFTNRTLVYVAFALVGVVVGALVTRERLAEELRRSSSAASRRGRFSRSACLRSTPTTDASHACARRSSYWNELALLCDAGVPLALWLARRRRSARASSCSTRSSSRCSSRTRVSASCSPASRGRCLGAARPTSRVESLAAVALGGGAGAAVFGIALALPGITKDGRAAVGARARRLDLRARPRRRCAASSPSPRACSPAIRSRRSGARASSGSRASRRSSLAIGGLAVSIAFAGRIWRDFTNPASAQINSQSNRLLSANSSNRWTWWQEAWHAFTRHPLGGTGAGTFTLTTGCCAGARSSWTSRTTCRSSS